MNQRWLASLLLCAFLIAADRSYALSCAEIDGAQIFGADTLGYAYLGFFGTVTAADSVMNPNIKYGNNDLNSIRGQGIYGAPAFSVDTAATDATATNPPVIVKGRQILGRLTTNTQFSERISVADVDGNCTFSATTADGALLPSPVSVDASDSTFNGDLENNGAIRIVWTINILNQELPAATGVQVEIADSPEGTRTLVAATSLSNTLLTGTGGSTIVRGLEPERDYIVWVTPTNSAGLAQLPNQDQGTAQYVTAEEPSDPQSLAVLPGFERLTLTFSPPVSDGGKPITEYLYFVAPLDAGETACATRRRVTDEQYTSASGSPIVLRGLTSGVEHDILLRACNVDSCSFGSVCIAGTPTSEPEAPETPTITAIEFDGEALAISITTGATNGAPVTQYTADCGSGLTGSAAGTTITVLGAIEGQRYNCVVTATNSAGTSMLSSSLSVVAEVISQGLNLPLLIRALENAPSP